MAHRWELRSIDPASSAIRQLGNTLYNLRIRAGLTQQELAALTGGRWSRSHIGRVENGDVTPSPDFVEAMDGLLDGGHALVRCLPVLLLESARQRSKRHWQRQEPSPPPVHPISATSPTAATRPTEATGPTPTTNPTRQAGPIGQAGGAAAAGSTGRADRPSPAGLTGRVDRADRAAAPDAAAEGAATDAAGEGAALGGLGESGVSGDPSRSMTTTDAAPTANRSQFLRMSLWAALGAVLESLRLTLRVEGPAGGPVSHEQLELAVGQYARAYWATPAGGLFEQVRQCRQLVDGMLDQHQPANHRRHLHLVAGWLSALLGNLSFHLGDYASARAHLCTAWRLGQAAGHNGLVAWVRGAQSMVELYDGRPGEALRLAREGQALAPNALVRAQLASWGEARALARMGDRRGVLDAVARGSKAIESSDESSDQDWSPGGVFSFSVGEFEQYCGTACLWLDLPNEAKRHVEHAFQLRDTQAAKALARLDLAAAESQLGRPAEASEIGAEVLRMPPEYLIDPILRRANELAATLEPHRSLPAVRDFNDQLVALASPMGEARAARSAGER